MNRILKTLLTIMLLATTATSQALDINTSEKKVYIYTADDLFALRGIIESYGFFKGYTLYLMNDIDLGGSARNFCNNIIGWEDKHEFQGTFDGQGHTISNLYIKIQNNNRGLFGWIYNATIRNLRLLNPYVEAGSSEYGHVGALVGKSEGGSLIENCAVIGGTVRPYLGADYDEIGGICGVMEDTGRILNCYCTSTVGAGNKEDRVGGILGSGENNDSGNKIWITNCYFAGTVQGDGSVGALVGRQGNVRFSTCYWLETSGSWANGASKNNPSGTTKYTADELQNPYIFGADANNWIYPSGNYPELACFYQYPVGESFYTLTAATVDESAIDGYVRILEASDPVKVQLANINTHTTPAGTIEIPGNMTTYFGKSISVTSIDETALSMVGTCNNLVLPATIDSLPVPFRHDVQNSISFADANDNYEVVDGALYSTSDKKLITIPKTTPTTLTIHQQKCDSIADYAFENSAISSIYINTYVSAGTTIDKTNVPVIGASENTFAAVPAKETETLNIFIKDGTSDQLFYGKQSLSNGYGYSNADIWKSFWSKYDDDTQHLFAYYPLQRNQAGKSTLILGFDVQLPDDITAWWCRVIGSSELTVRKLGTQIVPALTPVLLTYEPSTTLDYLTIYDGDDAGDATDYEDNLFRGTVDPGGHLMTASELTTNFFTLGRQKGGDWSTVGFYPYHPTNHVLPPYVAYIASADVPTEARFTLTFSSDDEEATAIRGVSEGQTARPQTVFSLSGQRLTAPKRGLNIINGRKVFIR